MTDIPRLLDDQQVLTYWHDLQAAAIRQAWDELPAWTPDAVQAVADRLGLAPAQVRAVLGNGSGE